MSDTITEGGTRVEVKNSEELNRLRMKDGSPLCLEFFEEGMDEPALSKKFASSPGSDSFNQVSSRIFDGKVFTNSEVYLSGKKPKEGDQIIFREGDDTVVLTVTKPMSPEYPDRTNVYVDVAKSHRSHWDAKSDTYKMEGRRFSAEKDAVGLEVRRERDGVVLTALEK